MRFEALIAAAGLGQAPLALSLRSRDQSLDWAQGQWPDGKTVASKDRFYAASLGKQVTGAAIAVLARRGLLDVDAPIGTLLPDLPAWRRQVTTRHLLHHLAGLPEPDPLSGPGHWTSASAMRHLRENLDLVATPGSAYRYSNAGYICLAAIAEQVAGQPFSRFVRQNLFDPLDLADIDFTVTPDFPQLAALGPALPLSLGDGGIWTSAEAFAHWLDHQNRDTLGIAALVQSPGRLNDGTSTDYGWGIGLRKRGPHDLFIHGGGWPGANCKAVRCPALDFSLVVLAATDGEAGVIGLVDTLTAQFAGPSELG